MDLGDKTKKIFESCKTREQHETAWQWAKLALKRAKRQDDLALGERISDIIFNFSFRRH